jgi:hypothetical protein
MEKKNRKREKKKNGSADLRDLITLALLNVSFIFLFVPFFIYFFYFFFCCWDKCFIQDVVEDACLCVSLVLYALPFSSSFSTYYWLSRLVANRYGKDWTYLDRCASLHRSRSQSQKRKRIKGERYERRHWFTGRGDRLWKPHSQQWQSLSLEMRINRACGKTQASRFPFSFFINSSSLGFPKKIK